MFLAGRLNLNAYPDKDFFKSPSDGDLKIGVVPRDEDILQLVSEIIYSINFNSISSVSCLIQN